MSLRWNPSGHSVPDSLSSGTLRGESPSRSGTSPTGWDIALLHNERNRSSWKPRSLRSQQKHEFYRLRDNKHRLRRMTQPRLHEVLVLTIPHAHFLEQVLVCEYLFDSNNFPQTGHVCSMSSNLAARRHFDLQAFVQNNVARFAEWNSVPHCLHTILNLFSDHKPLTYSSKCFRCHSTPSGLPCHLAAASNTDFGGGPTRCFPCNDKCSDSGSNLRFDNLLSDLSKFA